MKAKNTIVALYGTHEEAEAAVKELKSFGFDMNKLSIVGRGYHTEEQVLGFFTTGDWMKFWSKRGAFWGGLAGMLVGSGLILLPGIGPLVVMGPVVSWLVNTAAGVAVGSGLSAFGGVLYSLGIPRDSVLKYEKAIKADKFLLIFQGNPASIAEAKGILETSAELANVYQLSKPGTTKPPTDMDPPL